MGFDICSLPDQLQPDLLGRYDRRVVRQAIFDAWDGRCAYCDSSDARTLDHVLPRFLGGISEPSNLIPCCHQCNAKKGCDPIEEWYKSQPFFNTGRLGAIEQWRRSPWI